MSAATSPAMPAFSYAQAAKGLAPSTAPVVKETKDEPVEQQQPTNAQLKSEAQVQPAHKPSRSHSRAEDKEVKRTAKDDQSSVSVRDGSQDKDTSVSSRRSQQKSSTSSVASPRLTANNEAAKETPTPSAPVESLEASATLDKESNASDKGKGKENDDDWEKVSIPSSAAADKELKAAPIPVVNIWQQRKEAQEAKRREIAAQKPNTPATAPVKSSDDTKRKPTHERESSKAVNKSDDRPDSSNQVVQPSTRGEKQEAKALVGDATAWPTPETANVDERKKSAVVDKGAPQPESRSNSKNHGKQWVQMPFVPTAKFETQLPTGAAKRGGRSGRAGRDGNSRGAHFNNGDRADNAGSMAPPPPPREDRGRKNDANRGGRASSLPANNPRAASRESNAATSRKPSAPVTKDTIPIQASAAPPFVPASEAVPSNVTSQDPSRSSSSQKRTGNNSPKAVNNAASQSLESSTEVLTQAAPIEGASRQSTMPERTKTAHNNYRSNEYSRPDRNGAPRKDREWSREKTENAREKVESWRDREYSGEGPPRLSRGERGRGGFRGRGQGYNPNYQGSQSYTSPLPQGGFDVPKPQHEARARQSSQPYTQNPAPQGRNPTRAQSIPMPMIYTPQNFYGNIAMQHGMQPIQTDMQPYGMAPSMPMHQGIMSAMPYNDSLNSYAVMSLVATQVNYYFSIDNLCKDLFLRKHMDGNGWVPLNVIASFKRIQTLLEDKSTIDVVRVAVQNQTDIEYARGPDGEELVRRKEGWGDFILESHERFPDAQREGLEYSSGPPQQHYQQLPYGSGEAMPFVPHQVRSPPPTANGMYNGPVSPTPYGMVPPFDGIGTDEHIQMPQSARFDQRDPSLGQEPLRRQESGRGAPVPSQNGHNVNGHHRTASRGFTEETAFPDEKISEIHILKRIIPAAGDERSMPAIEPVRSNESQTSFRDATGRKPSDQQGLRLQGLKFGSSAVDTDGPIVFTKDGQRMRLPDEPLEGHQLVPYYVARSEAQRDREHGVEDAMEHMYDFWYSFLAKQFNLTMYNEFTTLARDDNERGDARGMNYLLKYYGDALKQTPPIPAQVARDLVELFRNEAGPDTPVLKLLRQAWRNGALNLKSRKRIQDHLTVEEKTQLDRAG